MERGELPKIQVEDIREEILFEDTPLHSFRHHTRAFLKVQDGCNARCSYCIVPQCQREVEEPCTGKGFGSSEGFEGEGI